MELLVIVRTNVDIFFLSFCKFVGIGILGI